MRNSNNLNRNSRRDYYRHASLRRDFLNERDYHNSFSNRSDAFDELETEDYVRPHTGLRKVSDGARRNKRTRKMINADERFPERREEEQGTRRRKKRERSHGSDYENYRLLDRENYFPQNGRAERGNHLRERSFDEWRRNHGYNEHNDDNLSIRIRDDYYAPGFVNERRGEIPGDYYEVIRDAEDYDYQGRDRLKYKNPHQRYRSVNY